MIFKEIDFSSENEELLATIEKNCAVAVTATNEIRNAERLLSQQKKESSIEQKNVSVKNIEVEVKIDDEFEEMIKCFKVDYASLEDGFDEDELFDYANVPDQYRTIRTPLYEEDYDDYNYEEYEDEIDKHDFDISL